MMFRGFEIDPKNTGVAALLAALYGWVRLPETMGLRARQPQDEAASRSEPAAARAAQAEALQVKLHDGSIPNPPPRNTEYIKGETNAS